MPRRFRLTIASMRIPNADLDRDGRVDQSDLGILISAFGSSVHEADLTGDGFVDSEDLQRLLLEYGASRPRRR